MHATNTDLGFEDCSAKVTDVTDSQFSSGSFFVEHEEIAAKAWNFYAFNVSGEDYQVVVNVAGELESGDACEALQAAFLFLVWHPAASIHPTCSYNGLSALRLNLIPHLSA